MIIYLGLNRAVKVSVEIKHDNPCRLSAKWKWGKWCSRESEGLLIESRWNEPQSWDQGKTWTSSSRKTLLHLHMFKRGFLGGHMLLHDLLNTWYPSVLSFQLTASPPARTVAPAADPIPVCVARGSRAPAVKRWLQSKCTSATEAPWDGFSPAPTPFRRTNHGEGPLTDRPWAPPRFRAHDLQPPDSRLTPCKFSAVRLEPLVVALPYKELYTPKITDG